MGTGEIILFILMAGISVSYGWGMRGTTIGGEKGAMLPGAIMGLLIAVFSPSPLLREQFFMLSGMGAMAMYLGGCMTYGETLGLTMNTWPPENMKKGLIAVFVKGGIWFSLFGGVMGMYLTASAGEVYKTLDFVVMFALIPPLALGGYFLLNKPLDPKNNKFPKIYFSKTRQESWGGLLGILLLMVIIMFLRGDCFALKLMLGSGLSGAVGWVIAQLFHVYGRHPKKNGKYIFPWLQKKKLMEAWKLMECVLGAIGGMGIALTLVLLQGDLENIAAAHVRNGALWSPIAGHGTLITAVWMGLIALDMLQFVFREPLKKPLLEKLLNKKYINKVQYKKELARTKQCEASGAFKKYRLLVEGFEFPLYSVAPMLFALLGVKEVAMLASFFVVYWVIVQETAFLNFSLYKNKHLFRIVTLGLGAAVVIAQFFFDWTPGIKSTMLMYGLFYELITLAYLVRKVALDRPAGKTPKKGRLLAVYGGIVPVHIAFLVMVVIMAAFVFLYV
ncbi:MAG: hypothetical protein LBS36_04085 [Oscillospiraceae bacterium]|jgi:hypothetical protein|nr:hypothetical protein [Oscillospiraceae bacterium]